MATRVERVPEHVYSNALLPLPECLHQQWPPLNMTSYGDQSVDFFLAG